MADKPDNIHTGHRQRLKQRYLAEGLDSFDEHQVLELLLYYALPQGDTNELGHRLIKHYGSLPAIVDAGFEDLQRVEGVGPHTALLLTLLPDLWRYYHLARGKPRDVFNSRAAMTEYVRHLFIGAGNEAFYLICLDTRNQVTRAVRINEGSVDSVGIEARIVAEAALRYKAKNVILAHNHPGGSLKPTSADLHITGQLTVALLGLDIGVLDHIIVAGDEYLSFWEKGLLTTT